ncbi:MAG: Calx-beta domain-containing protein, partial [Candidatus Bathyarchaeia archaeon]
STANSTTVSYTTTDVTARSGRDYRSTSGVLSFGTGVITQSFSVEIINNSAVDGSRVFDVSLFNPSGGATLGLSRAAVVINDDDVAQPGQLQFSSSAFTVNENGGSAAVTVTRTGGSNVPVSVFFGVSGGSAISGVDFLDVSGRLDFGVGVTTQTIFVTPLNNNRFEGDKTVILRLNSPTNGATLGLSTTTVTIVDDELPPKPPQLRTLDELNFGDIESGDSRSINVDVSNVGEQTLIITEPPAVRSGSSSGFSISRSIGKLSLEPGENTQFEVTFQPTQLSSALAGLVEIGSNGGSATIRLSGNSVDTKAPEVTILTPRGGESVVSGKPMIITFQATDRNGVAYIVASASVTTSDSAAGDPASDAFTVFDIGRVGGENTSLIWNIPDGLESSGAKINISAFDSSGNNGSASSGIFSISQPTGETPKPQLRVSLNFDPPPPGQIAPPQNLRVNAVQDRGGVATPEQAVLPDTPQLVGYNIYRVPQPPPEQPQPTPEEIVNLINLVGSTPPNITSFTDSVSTSKGDNFAYSVTSTFSSGQQSGGSKPAGTDLPVIKNPRFIDNTIKIDLANSFIKQGAVLIIDDTDIYPLEVDPSGILFQVPKKAEGSASGLTIRNRVKRGETVTLTVKNQDGKQSLAVSFTRN